MRFLFNLDFRLQVTVEAFMNCCLKLENESGRYEEGQADPSLWVQRPAKQRWGETCVQNCRLQEQNDGGSTLTSSKQKEFGMQPSTLLFKESIRILNMQIAKTHYHLGTWCQGKKIQRQWSYQKKNKARKSNDSDLIKKICSKIFIIAQALHNNWFHVTSVAFFSNRNW